MNIPCFSGSCSEIYKEKAFKQLFPKGHSTLEVAKELSETSLMFLVHPTLNNEDIYKIVNQTTDIVKLSSR
jgi:dTDP-4-amino-4,6-dideoxygalactose transaminase